MELNSLSPGVAQPQVRLEPVAKEQLAYAVVLDIGVKISLLLLTGTFALYTSGMLQSKVSFDDLQRCWSMPAEQFKQCTGRASGWQWASQVSDGDYMNYLGIVLLAGISGVCYLRILPALLARGDRAYVLIALAEIAVLILAASGVLSAGAH